MNQGYMNQGYKILVNRAWLTDVPTFLWAHKKVLLQAARTPRCAKGEAEFYLVGLEADDGRVRLDGDEDLWPINDV